MAAHKTRRVLTVFLASPSDVAEEREIAAGVVDTFNKQLGPYLDWNIELRRWEDLKPGYGRPQGIINSDVDSCNLFIGLLWERWGQPTGAYTSGFHEEFERALARRQSGGEPDIWLVFKKPRPEKLSDPGPELKKVAEFRVSESAQGRVLFREVATAEEWRSRLQEWLYQHMLQLAFAGAGATQELLTKTAQPNQATTIPISDESSQKRPNRKLPGQLVEIGNKLAAALSGGKLEFARDDANMLQELDVARLYLFSLTMMAQRYTSASLGTHEANLLYKHRTELQFATEELYEVLRTIVQDTSAVIPGWFWFDGKIPGGAADTLLSLAYDSNSDVRVGALKLLASAQIPLSADQLESLPLKDDSYSVSSAAFQYLGAVGDETALGVIERTAVPDNSLVSATAQDARSQILRRIAPKRAFLELTAPGLYWRTDLVRSFEQVIELQATDDLVRGAASQDADVRALSVEELAKRGELSLALAEGLRDDTSTEVRQRALQVIVNSRGEDELTKLKKAQTDKPGGGSLSNLAGILAGHATGINLDSIEFNYFMTLSGDNLSGKIDWLAAQGPAAYRALGLRHLELLSPFIRADIANGFERIRKCFIEKTDAEFGSGAGQKMDEKLKSRTLDTFIRAQYLGAALSVLAEHAIPDDVEIARQYLRNEDREVQLSAVKIISLFGGDQDVIPLLDLSDNALGEMTNLAPSAAIRLSGEPLKLALEMANSGKKPREDAALRWLSQQDGSDAVIYFRDLLDDKEEGKRISAIRYFVRNLNPPELRSLLDEYLRGDVYFYDVVTWLDRILFAPLELADSYLRALGQTA